MQLNVIGAADTTSSCVDVEQNRLQKGNIHATFLLLITIKKNTQELSVILEMPMYQQNLWILCSAGPGETSLVPSLYMEPHKQYTSINPT